MPTTKTSVGTITTGRLLALDACSNQVALFEREWPDGCEVTRETITRAMKLGLDIGWAVSKLLTLEKYPDYHEKRAAITREYDAKRATIYAEYDDKRATIGAEYDRLRTRAALSSKRERRLAIYAEYDAKRAVIDAEYGAKRAAIDAEYDDMMATLIFSFV